MKKLMTGALLATLTVTPALAMAFPGTTVTKTYYGHAIGPDRDAAHDVARLDALHQAEREAYGNCVETTVAIAELDDGWHVTSVQECVRL